MQGDPSALSQVALNTLLWEAAVMTLVIGLVNIGVGANKTDPKAYGVIILSGAIMETLATAFIIWDENVFGATVAAAFVLLLWMLGIDLIIGGNPYVISHALWFTGILFAGFTAFTAVKLHMIFLSVALGLLVPVTVGAGVHGYTGSRAAALVAGYASLIDGFVFLVMAFAGAIGVSLP